MCLDGDGIASRPHRSGGLAQMTIMAQGPATKAFSPMSGCEPCCAETHGLCANCTKCLNDKTGDCAFCWKEVSPGLDAGLLGSDYLMACLGHEDPVTGGPPTHWPVGTLSKPWSPGCKKCWKNKDACKRGRRDFEEVLV